MLVSAVSRLQGQARAIFRPALATCIVTKVLSQQKFYYRSNPKIVCHIAYNHRSLLAYFGSNRSKLEFSEACEETLLALTEYFEELVESLPEFKNGDVSYSDGVLTVSLGSDFGTYVINRQTPNQQIWLSSPTSGPKRYDFTDGVWVYKHDGTTLNSLLDQEISAITKAPVSFTTACIFQRK